MCPARPAKRHAREERGARPTGPALGPRVENSVRFVTGRAAGGSLRPTYLRCPLAVARTDAGLERASRSSPVHPVRIPAPELRAPPLLAVGHGLVHLGISRDARAGRCARRQHHARDDREERRLLHERHLPGKRSLPVMKSPDRRDTRRLPIEFGSGGFQHGRRKQGEFAPMRASRGGCRRRHERPDESALAERLAEHAAAFPSRCSMPAHRCCSRHQRGGKSAIERVAATIRHSRETSVMKPTIARLRELGAPRSVISTCQRTHHATRHASPTLFRGRRRGDPVRRRAGGRHFRFRRARRSSP